MSSQSALQIDLSNLPPRVVADIQREMEDSLARYESEAIWADLCENGTDQDIIARAHYDYGLTREAAPITLADRYSVVETWQEGWHHVCKRHPRRPVYMKGSRHCRYARYSSSNAVCGNGWAEMVFARFVRHKKITALTRAENDAQIAPIFSAIKQRHYTTYHFDPAGRHYSGKSNFYADDAAIWLAGKRIHLTDREFDNIKALHNILTKFSKLEERKAAAVAHMHSRLSQ